MCGSSDSDGGACNAYLNEGLSNDEARGRLGLPVEVQTDASCFSRFREWILRARQRRSNAHLCKATQQGDPHASDDDGREGKPQADKLCDPADQPEAERYPEKVESAQNEMRRALFPEVLLVELATELERLKPYLGAHISLPYRRCKF